MRPPPHELTYTARGTAMSYGWVGGTTPLDMTSVTDGRTHAIAAADFDAGLWAGQGRYPAILGAQVIAAAMASAPRPQGGGQERLPDERELRGVDGALADESEVLDLLGLPPEPVEVDVGRVDRGQSHRRRASGQG